MVNDTIDLLLRILGLLGTLGGTALGLAKFMRWLSRDRRQVEHAAARWEIESFQASIKALQEENARCWADNARLKDEHRVECEQNDKDRARLREQVRDLEESLERRRKLVHDQNNQLQVVQMMLQEYMRKYGAIDFDLGPGKPEPPPDEIDENGDPK